MALSDQLPFLQKIQFDDIYSTFMGWDRRRQTFAIAGAVVALLVILFFPISYVSGELNAKEEEYLKHVERASKFFGYLAEYKKLENMFNEVEKTFAKMGADSVTTIVYNLASEIGIEKNKISLKQANFPAGEGFQEVGKEVSMRAVPFDQMMRLLDKLTAYSELPLSIKKLTIKADLNDKKIMQQVSFTVSTVKPGK